MLKIKKSLIMALALMVALSGFPAMAMAEEAAEAAGLNNEAGAEAVESEDSVEEAASDEEFDMGSVIPTSLLPLYEVELKEINLNDANHDDLKTVKVKELFIKKDTNETISLENQEIWYTVYVDSSNEESLPYTKVTPESEINIMKLVDEFDRGINIVFAVGKPALQLNPDMVRYILKVKSVEYKALSYDIGIYVDNGDTRTALKASENSKYIDEAEVYSVEAPADLNADLWLGINEVKIDGEALKDCGCNLAIYKGEYKDYDKLKAAISDGSAEEISSVIIDESIASAGKGIKYGKLNDSNKGFKISTVVTKNGILRNFDSYTLKLVKEKQIVYIDHIDKVADPSDKPTGAFQGLELKTYGDDRPLSFSGDIDADYKIYLGSKTLANLNAGVANIKKAVLGYFDNIDKAANREDIKDALFGNEGYKTKLQNGKRFTIFTNDGSAYKLYLKVYKDEPPVLKYDDLWFEVTGADGYQAYVLDERDDSRHMDRDRVFILSDKDADLSKLKMTFRHDNKSTVFASGEATVLQTSGVTERNFSGAPVQYTVSSGDKKKKLDYKVTCVKKYEGGSKLFVSGQNDKDESGQAVRECFIDAYHGGYHDVFIANIGSEKLTGIQAHIEDPQNVRIDDYWQVGGYQNQSLAAFNSVNASGNTYGKLSNIGKIRLLKDGDGDIAGTLVVKADGQEAVRLKLTGKAGDPRITTKSIPHAVQYVPYQSIVQTQGGAPERQEDIGFKLAKGSKLPEGISLMPNGEICGIMKKPGSYTFSIDIYSKMLNEERDDTSDREKEHYKIFDSKKFTLDVRENTDTNVNASTDTGYEVQTRIANGVDGTQALVFKSAGKFEDFLEFYIDGNVLEGDDLDYKAENGSTVITIKAETAQRFGEGKHTVAASFKKDKRESETLKRAAQNYTWKGYVEPNSGSSSSGGKKPSGGGASKGGSSSSGGAGSTAGGSGSSAATDSSKAPQSNAGNTSGIQSATDSTPNSGTVETIASFGDVKVGSWYAQDVQWVYEKGLMKGTGESTFAPKSKIKGSTVVTILSRVAKADLAKYQVEGGKWYSAAEAWAKEKELISKDMATSDVEISRGDLAVMLLKYLKLANIAMPLDTELEGIHFADEAQMSPEQLEAFKILYKLGVFKGKDASAFMDINAGTTRAEIAALFHRMEQYVK